MSIKISRHAGSWLGTGISSPCPPTRVWHWQPHWLEHPTSSLLKLKIRDNTAPKPPNSLSRATEINKTRSDKRSDKNPTEDAASPAEKSGKGGINAMGSGQGLTVAAHRGDGGAEPQTGHLHPLQHPGAAGVHPPGRAPAQRHGRGATAATARPAPGLCL